MKIVSLCIFMCCLFNLNAQADSIPIGRVTYFQQVDVLGDVYKNGYSSLLFNNLNSLYIHNGAPKHDSSYVDANNVFPVSVSGDKEGFPIYKQHAERQVFCKVVCREYYKEHCIVRDTFGNIAWKLYPEHKRFGQYDCRRAIGKFRGREYEVWYTTDIPIPSGPFKLGGLPGLILEATSIDGRVKFLFNGLEISTNISNVIRFPSGKNLNINQDVFEENNDAFNNNLVKEYRAKGIDMSVSRQETIEIWSDQ